MIINDLHPASSFPCPRRVVDPRIGLSFLSRQAASSLTDVPPLDRQSGRRSRLGLTAAGVEFISTRRTRSRRAIPSLSGSGPMKRLALPLFLGLCSFLGGLTAVRLSSSAGNFAWANAADVAAKLEDRFEVVARKVSPAVVALEAVKPTVEDGKARSIDDSGSGSLVRFPGKSGTYVLTNYHVIGAAAPRQITVNTADGKILKPTR